MLSGSNLLGKMMLYYFRYLIIGVLALICVVSTTCATTPEVVQTTPTIQIMPSDIPTLSPTSTSSPTVTSTSVPIQLTQTPTPPISPTDIPTLSPTSTSSPTVTSTSTPIPPTPTPTPPISPISDFPLNLGNTWIYSYAAYSTNDSQNDNDIRDDQIITATSLITETVVNTRLHGDYFVAKIVKSKTVITLSVDTDELDHWHSHNWYGVKSGEETYWYVITGTHVYRQQKELDLTTVESSWLEYVFPLEERMGWYPDSWQRDEFPDIDTGPSSGIRVAYGPVKKQIPGGEFENCFKVLTIYLGGGTESWFCLGVGFVGEEFDHMGTPFGLREVLIDYIIKSP